LRVPNSSPFLHHLKLTYPSHDHHGNCRICELPSQGVEIASFILARYKTQTH